MSRPETASLAEIASARYLNYALSVITSRALPDIRDGLKPVQRRILYTMLNDLHVGPDAKFMKCARIVGEVMGKYHPHGDQSIYDAMVRMAQDWQLRYPLVDGHGNFGSIDGDPPAAFRYTEAKLRHLALELLEELKQETVPFVANYDGTRQEPAVLPAQIPNLLVNGTAGIAVGMATNIPPHNLKEVVQALIALVDDPSLQPDQLTRFVKGPDFPTGGLILNDKAELKEIYRTGSGSIRMRGTWELEKDGRRSYLVITSIPYGLEKSGIVARIGELIGARQVPQLTDVRDESTEDVRIVCEMKAGANAEAAAAFLFKNTPLQQNFNVNMTCLVPTAEGTCVPERANLSTMLRHFLDFRMQVVTRRHEFERKQLAQRLHLLEGFEKVFADLDRAIEIIRESAGRPEAFAGLVKAFGLSEVQANAVLDMRLYKLSKGDIKEIQKEAREVRARIKEIDRILASEEERWGIVKSELEQLLDVYTDARRTRIQGPVEEVEYRAEDYIVDEDAWVVVTRDGWIKRQKRFTDVESIRVREGDQVGWLYRGRARQCVTYFSNAGTAYTMRIDQVPMTAGHGEPLGRHFQLGDGETLVGVVCHDPRCLPAPTDAPPPPAPSLQPPASEDTVPPGPYAVAVTRLGRTLRLPIWAHAEPSQRKGRLFCRLSAEFPADQVVVVSVPAADDEIVAVATRETRVLAFPVGQVSILAGPGRGVTAIKMDGDDQVIAAAVLGGRKDDLTVETNRGMQQVVARDKGKVGNRAGKGQVLMARDKFVRQVMDPVQPVPEASQVKDDDADAGPSPEGARE